MVFVKCDSSVNKISTHVIKFILNVEQVRNEAAEDFLILLKEWKKLCEKFSLISSTEPMESISELEDEEGDEDDDIDEATIGTDLSPGEFEVQEFLAIVFGDPNDKGEKTLHLRVLFPEQ